MRREGQDRIDQAEAALNRMADATGAKTVTGGGIRASWVSYKARFEVSIAADDEQALAAIMTALQPLKGRTGVSAIKPHKRPPSS